MIKITRNKSDITIGTLNEQKLLSSLQLISVKFLIISNEIIEDEDGNVVSDFINIFVSEALTTEENTSMGSEISIHNSFDLRASIRANYEGKSIDGTSYFNLAHDDLVEDVMTETIDEETAFLVENKLLTSFDKLKGGDWKSAKVMLDGVTDLTLTTQAQTDYLTQYYNTHKTYIEAYILENYA